MTLENELWPPSLRQNHDKFLNITINVGWAYKGHMAFGCVLGLMCTSCDLQIPTLSFIFLLENPQNARSLQGQHHWVEYFFVIISYVEAESFVKMHLNFHPCVISHFFNCLYFQQIIREIIRG